MSKSGCWSMLKGGFTVDQYMKAQLYFLSNNTYVRLWLDNVSLKSFAKEQWSKQQEKSTLEDRKRKIRINVYSHEGKKLQGLKIPQTKRGPVFMLGCAVAKPLIDIKAYQEGTVCPSCGAFTQSFGGGTVGYSDSNCNSFLSLFCCTKVKYLLTCKCNCIILLNSSALFGGSNVRSLVLSSRSNSR
ncbi:uncharacterized protein LOC111394497 isoform X2 [Olea europaea var. sylvestris]|uniref:Endo-1,4-beta-xylanase A-like n=2 Tax=Olea europaea subsp. europaea TaxID=158383 RepID=A0A8S0SYJ2_OLEEU|nr:uncharacterized protein LOC111394497 isoform X2 [Olea europaea var. sylvestris]XP_022876121.1 uncharacterized protein LOC111394497 isoform X2 [Olea europaea var. sylvestris]CAA2997701.1 endo-1,4-beta-xylanase A-like [Olea europaea subsp. europaea]